MARQMYRFRRVRDGGYSSSRELDGCSFGFLGTEESTRFCGCLARDLPIPSIVAGDARTLLSCPDNAAFLERERRVEMIHVLIRINRDFMLWETLRQSLENRNGRSPSCVEVNCIARG